MGQEWFRPDKSLRAESSKLSGQALQEAFRSITRRLFQAFGVFSNDDRLNIYAQTLIDSNWSQSELEAVLKEAISTLTKMPTIADLKNIYGGMFPKDRNKTSEDSIKAYESEQKRYSQIKEAFIKEYGEDKLFGYINYWACISYGSQYVDELRKFGLSLEIFEKSALFDLQKAGFKFERVKDIAKNPTA